jgi:hypothetical protein
MQSWRKVGAKLAQSWRKVGAKLAQSWRKVGAKLAPSRSFKKSLLWFLKQNLLRNWQILT